ncbi:MAG: RNA polymerase sigma factor, partial [Promethearchaeota archaeon]
YVKIDQFKGVSKFSTWLFAIGINEMKTDLRRQKKDYVPVDEIINESILNVEFNFEWHHDMKWLLSELSENKKVVFILHEVEGYKHSEIADILDISDVASRTILSRTKQQLKEKWLNERGANADTG